MLKKCVLILLRKIHFYCFCRSWRKSSRARRFPGDRRMSSSQEFQNSWNRRVHFATFPVSTLGNWIPRVLSQWYCSGHGCGFDQIVIEHDNGNHEEFDILDVKHIQNDNLVPRVSLPSCLWGGEMRDPGNEVDKTRQTIVWVWRIVPFPTKRDSL